MSILDNMNTASDVQQETEDRVQGEGFKPIDSDLYDATIDYAFLDVSKGGAIQVRLEMTTDDGKKVRDSQWITSGTKKGCKTYYFERDPKTKKETTNKRYLPGFIMINDLVSVATGFPFALDIKTEKRTIELYDFTARAQKQTEVEMIVGLLGKKVSVAVMSVIQDKEALNDATGKYEPTGKTTSKNEVKKYLHAGDNKTLIELKAKAPDAVFAPKWLKTWKGKVDDTSTTTANAGVTGTPAASGDQAPQESIFAD